MKELKKQKPYFVKAEEDFQQNVILPKIDQEKALINQIRQKMRKPMDMSEFQEHQIKYLEKQKMLELEKLQSKQSRSPDYKKSPQNLHQGKYHKLLQELDEKQKYKEEERLEKLRSLKQKQEKYDKFVKEYHPAHVSPGKQLQLQSVMSQIKHPVRQKKSSYDNYLADIVIRHNRSRQGDKTKSSIQYSNLSSLQNIPDDYTKRPKHKDYLREMMNERYAKSALNSPINDRSPSPKFPSYHLELQKQLKKKDLTSQQKYELVKFKSEALEQRAHEFEHGFKQQDLTIQSQVNNLYLDSIKAKMALIEQL
ncbi:UNKNOWN [Stylonychia lemnae]|uniref:Uncharacterized protein n=1 Tax=Stylonychia lemnae TaxID=5949 RepID=A0A078B6J7_STYLE|nr:UNKNOWN [Stylonychia lemnae]|eukprot:CDW89846.1 UNKNOWN [Stylonychia lemnae]